MPTWTFGAPVGADFSSLAAAIADAGVLPGDTLEGLGATTEANQSISINKADLTITFLAPYVFDGTGVTQTCMSFDAAGITLDGMNYLTITGYTADVLGALYVSPAGTTCAIQNVDMRLCGAAGVWTYGIYVQGTGALVRSNTVSLNVDALTGRFYAINVIGCSAARVYDNTLHTLRATGAAGRVYALNVNSTALGAQICGNTIYDVEGTHIIVGIFLTGGATPGQAGVVSRNVLYDIRSLTTQKVGIYISSGTWKVTNNLIYNLTGGTSGYGIFYIGATFDPLDAVCYLYNNTVDGAAAGSYGYGISPTYASTVKNNVATNNAVDGFYSANPAFITSDYNQANGNAVTQYDVAWVTGVNDGTDPPLYVNPGAGDYSLQATSLYIDYCVTLPEVRYDITERSRPQGARQDAGAYEYPGPSYVVVFGSHLSLGSSGTLAANFVLVSDGVTKVAATTVTHVTDFIAQFALLSGTAGTITPATNLLSDPAATFRLSDIGKALYVYDCDSPNWGSSQIQDIPSEIVIEGERTFAADPSSGSIKWAILPEWALNITDRFSRLDRTGSRVVMVEIPTGIPGGGIDYYIEIINPNGESTIFNNQVITIP